MKRCMIIVLDGVGIGAAPDAAQFDTVFGHTLAHVGQAVGGLQLPNLQKMGLGNIDRLPGVLPCAQPIAAYGKMAEKSPGKDSTTGHWELAGLALDFAFPTYPDGFPAEVLEPFCQAVGRGVLGNKPSSGTEVIERLGEEHLRTGNLILYTSGDSVFQIAAHEDVVPLPELYEICQKARRILTGKHAVGRVIARPFVGKTAKDFKRTSNRRDFSLLPPGDTLLSAAKKAGIYTYGIGKTDDLFANDGLCASAHTTNNADGIKECVRCLRELESGLIFVNLVEFDMLWGHRNDPVGFHQALMDFDLALPDILSGLRPGDLLLISADHGVDPTTPGSDHTREFVPILAYGGKAVDLGVRSTFADAGATAGEFFGLEFRGSGVSFWPEIK